jgi:hypothetical protein
MTRRKTIGLIASLAVTAVLAAGVVWAARSGGESAVGLLETPTPTATATVTAVPTPEPGTPTTLTPTPSATPVPSPAPLPPPEEGYIWWAAPSAEVSQELGVPPYAVQVPEDFSQPSDIAVATEVTFLPPGVARNFPYPPVPKLTILVSPVVPEPPGPEAGWKHPFVWSVGSQGGGGCTGDVSGYFEASPSSQHAGDTYTWDVYTFTCGVVNLNYQPGISYDGRAAEIRVGNLIFSIVAFEPPGSGAMEAPFQQAMDSFTLQ